MAVNLIRKSILKVYISGIGINGLYGIYKYNEYRNADNDSNMFKDSIMYPIGYMQGFLQGITWPLTITRKMFNAIQNIDVVSKNI